ncbi:MAG: hypothetical protein QOG03_2018 [Actinomycetota bacterium]|jgi:hypothetical protein|nr:hypothetical protein [Actinomycetota bacterium]
MTARPSPPSWLGRLDTVDYVVTESPSRLAPIRPLLVLPGLLLGGAAIFVLNAAYTAVLGDEASGQLAIPGLVVAAAAVAMGVGRRWGRWLGAGLVTGAGIAVAGLLALFSMFPSAASVTDRAGARIAEEHLDELERAAEFRAAPPGLSIKDSGQRSGCSDWFDRREPVTWRQYDMADRTADETVAFYRQRWEAAGYHQAQASNGPKSYVWHREFDGWTASLSLFIDGRLAEVEGRDLDSHACK